MRVTATAAHCDHGAMLQDQHSVRTSVCQAVRQQSIEQAYTIRITHRFLYAHHMQRAVVQGLAHRLHIASYTVFLASKIAFTASRTSVMRGFIFSWISAFFLIAPFSAL